VEFEVGCGVEVKTLEVVDHHVDEVVDNGRPASGPAGEKPGGELLELGLGVRAHNGVFLRGEVVKEGAA
jgi:hypothetical protein